MKNIIFTVSSVEKSAVAKVINGLKSYSGQCRIDFVSNKIAVDIAEEDKIDEVITFISQNYTIFRVDIADKQTEAKTVGDAVVSFVDDEDFVINNTRYTSYKVRTAFDKLFKVIGLAFASTTRITEDDIYYYIETCKHEMLLKFNPVMKVKTIQVGDIIAVNYGMHADGELCGEVFSVVCDIKRNMICTVPIMRNVDVSEQNCAFDEKQCSYYWRAVPKGTLMFDKAQYVRRERAQYAVGKVSDDYLNEIKRMLAQAFDFTAK